MVTNFGSYGFLQYLIALPMYLCCEFSANLPEARMSGWFAILWDCLCNKLRGAVLSARKVTNLSSLWTTSFKNLLWNAAAVSEVYYFV